MILPVMARTPLRNVVVAFMDVEYYGLAVNKSQGMRLMMHRCEKCVLPGNGSEVTLDDTGVCNLCRAHEQNSQSGPAPTARLLESDLGKLLRRHKGRHRYDCLVMCSGGKDSTAALWFVTRRSGIRPLVFTFDHGFETGVALDNVRAAVKALGVDWVLFRSEWMREMFARVVAAQSPAVLCHLCSIWYMQTAFDTARRYDAPLIVAGWTKGQKTSRMSSELTRGPDSLGFNAMGKATSAFLKTLRRDPRYSSFPVSMEEVIKRAGRKRAEVISPHWFLDAHADDYAEIIRRNLGWKPTGDSYPDRSTNCRLNWLSSYLSIRHFGYTHYHVEMSKLIRQGQMTRSEAIARLRMRVDASRLKAIASELGCTVDVPEDGKEIG